MGEAPLRSDLTGNEVTLDAERKNGEQLSTQKHREARLGPDWVPLSRQEQINDRGPAGRALKSATNEGISGSCRSRLEPGQVVPSSGDRKERHKHNNRAGTA